MHNVKKEQLMKALCNKCEELKGNKRLDEALKAVSLFYFYFINTLTKKCYYLRSGQQVVPLNLYIVIIINNRSQDFKFTAILGCYK